MFGLSVKNARQVNPSNNGCSLVPKARPRDSLTSHGNASASLDFFPACIFSLYEYTQFHSSTTSTVIARKNSQLCWMTSLSGQKSRRRKPNPKLMHNEEAELISVSQSSFILSVVCTVLFHNVPTSGISAMDTVEYVLLLCTGPFFSATGTLPILFQSLGSV